MIFSISLSFERSLIPRMYLPSFFCVRQDIFESFMHELNDIDKKKRDSVRERLEVIRSAGTGTPYQIGECINSLNKYF